MLDTFGEGLDQASLKLRKMSDNLEEFAQESWDDHWKDVMLLQNRGCLFGKDLQKFIIKK